MEVIVHIYFAIDYKLNLRLLKINGNPDGGEVFGIGNPVAGAVGVGGGGDLDAQGKKSCHPFGSQDGWSIAPYTFSTFAFSGRLLQANFLLLCPVIIFAKMSHTQINKYFVIGVVISYVKSRAMALGGI